MWIRFSYEAFYFGLTHNCGNIKYSLQFPAEKVDNSFSLSLFKIPKPNFIAEENNIANKYLISIWIIFISSV